MSRTPAWFPSPDGELLLRAALLDGDVAIRAWAAWRAAHIDEHFDRASFRLLPLVYKNLAANGCEDPYMGRLKGVYRRSWFLTQTLLTRTAGAVGRLEECGVPTLLLKGAGVACAHYRDAGARPMDDVDVAVPRERAAEAIALLTDAGFQPRRPVDERDLRLGHAETFSSHDGETVIDLHWSILWRAGPDEDLWQASVPIELHGVSTRTLSPADHVLQACAHGAHWNQIHPLRWVADVHAITSSGPVDWERLVRVAHARELGPPLADALAYVGERFDVPVPEEFPARLRAARVRPLRRTAQRVAALPPSPLRSGGLLFVYLDVYRAQTHDAGARPSPQGFLRWLQRYFDVADLRELVLRIGRSFAGGGADEPVMAPRT
jgi:hypothetical protein